MSLLLRDDIVTSRLTLIAITPEMLLSEKNGDGRLGELIQCVVPANWPLKDWEPHVFDFLLAQFAEHPEQLGWARYVSFVPPGGRQILIGTLARSRRLTVRRSARLDIRFWRRMRGGGLRLKAPGL